MLTSGAVQAGASGQFDIPLDEVARIKAETWGPGGGGFESSRPLRPLIVAEGDSWFDYPPGLDILDHLKRTYSYPIVKLSKAGDTLENMVYGTGYNRDFSRNPIPFGTLISTVAKERPSAVLFSAGGNDLVGEDLVGFLNHKDSGRPPLRMEYLRDVIHGFARNAYERAATEVWKVAPDALFVTHGYARPIPDGRAVFNFPFGFRFIGPWLRPAFTQKNIEQVEAREIVKTMIDEFNEMLSALATALGQRFVYIDLRDLVTDADWVNELHLSSAAYGRVAAEFDRRLPK